MYCNYRNVKHALIDLNLTLIYYNICYTFFTLHLSTVYTKKFVNMFQILFNLVYLFIARFMWQHNKCFEQHTDATVTNRFGSKSIIVWGQGGCSKSQCDNFTSLSRALPLSLTSSRPGDHLDL